MTQNSIENSKEFPYRPEDISYFSVALDTFIISLKTGETVLHVPGNPLHFSDWLISNGIRNVDADRTRRFLSGDTAEEETA